ncbi:MAG: hypothetical protein ABEK59_08990 [Halobacteria archaeon]
MKRRGRSIGSTSACLWWIDVHLDYVAGLADYVARGRDLDILLVVPVVSHEPPKNVDTRRAHKKAAKLEFRVKERVESDVDSMVQVRESLPSAVSELSDTFNVDCLVLEAVRDTRFSREDVTQKLIKAVDCDVFVVNPKGGFGEVNDVLVTDAEGPHSTLAAWTANLFARYGGAGLKLVHLVEPGSTKEEVEFDGFLAEIDDPYCVETEILESDDFAEDIVDLSEGFDLTLHGLPSQDRLTRYIMSSKHQDIEEKVGGSVISVRSR